MKEGRLKDVRIETSNAKKKKTGPLKLMKENLLSLLGMHRNI